VQETITGKVKHLSKIEIITVTLFLYSLSVLFSKNLSEKEHSGTLNISKLFSENQL